MGITQASLSRLQRLNLLYPSKMLELGAQNLYDSYHYGDVAKSYFTDLGIDHTSWDIVVYQGAIEKDLREDIPVEAVYDIVTDYGTTEHVSGNYYMAHKNIHNHCRTGGVIIHENPKTEHWPGHGYNYVNMEFYLELARLCDYTILELSEDFAMGNYTDGCNICVVMIKMSDKPFIDLETFNSIGNVFSK